MGFSSARALGLTIALAAMGQFSQVMAWGPTGHRVGGEIATPYLTSATRDHVTRILGTESLAEASVWADRMRDHPSRFWQETAPPLHYVTVPPGRSYASTGAPAKGDAMTALTRFRQILRDPGASLPQQQLALRFTIHIVGDLHQPLHAGNGRDRGGSRTRVSLLGKRTNLHAVWDSGMIRQYKLSWWQWADRLESEIGEAQLAAWSEPDPLVWIEESAALREEIYPADSSLAWPYISRHMPSVHLRLKQSGIRLAAYLNATWVEPEP